MINNTDSYKYKIIANGTTLDVFNDEPIKISNNILELFDIGILPSEISNDLSIPGSKVNNEFFKHYYDLSILSPDSYSTNKKIDCYIELDGVYIIQGYLMLNYVTLIEHSVQSYNITLYGILSSFGNNIKNKYLSDLTTLNEYNHYLNFTNIKNSWTFNLFEGNIVYPLAEFGQKIYYTNSTDGYGIDEPTGCLSLKTFKPGIKMMKVFDAIFAENGFTYESDFLKNDGYVDNIYLILNKGKSTLKFSDIELENYGTIKIGPVKETLSQPLTDGATYKLPYYSIQTDNNSKITTDKLEYTLDYSSMIRGKINLNFGITKNSTGKGLPYFFIGFKTPSQTYWTALKHINDYMDDIYDYLVSNNLSTPTESYSLDCEFTTEYIPYNVYEIVLKYEHQHATNFSIIIDNTDSPEGYFQITDLINVADGKEVVISEQFPEMTQLNFIKGIQQKFNLIIYPSKTKINHFIIQTFNEWYKRDSVHDFNKYIDISSQIKITPANNLAYKELTFSDKVDSDYVTKLFKDANNRNFGVETYTDDDNNYSSEKLEITTSFASSPLILLENSGTSGETILENYYLYVSDAYSFSGYYNCWGMDTEYHKIQIWVYSEYGTLYFNNGDDFDITIKFNVQKMYRDIEGNIISFNGTSNIKFTVKNGKQYVATDYMKDFSYYDDMTPCTRYIYTPVCVVSKPSNVYITNESPIQPC